MAKKYKPASIPSFSTIEELTNFLNIELRRFSEIFNANTENPYDVKHEDYDKHEDGMIIYADGTNFDPGAGKGLYIRNDGTWQKL